MHQLVETNPYLAESHIHKQQLTYIINFYINGPCPYKVDTFCDFKWIKINRGLLQEKFYIMEQE